MLSDTIPNIYLALHPIGPVSCIKGGKCCEIRGFPDAEHDQNAHVLKPKLGGQRQWRISSLRPIRLHAESKSNNVHTVSDTSVMIL
jgi:hypothetical protein